MRVRTYCAHLSIHDHCALRGMNRCPEQEVGLKRDPQCLTPQASLELIYRPTAVGMKRTFGRGSLVAKVMDSWLACHEFELSAFEDPPCREGLHVKSVESSNVLPLVWCGSKERGCQLRFRPRHLTMVQNYEVRLQKLSRS
ncbi:uncharacterized protein TNCV_630761 [Trichonephila clavipes]|nr:uncharacterized protein TNCV_630761 [Trichonephila clavipes]